MKIRKNLGIILMMLGVMLTIGLNQKNDEWIEYFRKSVESYWPILISFLGIYLISSPKKKK